MHQHFFQTFQNNKKFAKMQENMPFASSFLHLFHT